MHRMPGYASRRVPMASKLHLKLILGHLGGHHLHLDLLSLIHLSLLIRLISTLVEGKFDGRLVAERRHVLKHCLFSLPDVNAR